MKNQEFFYYYQLHSTINCKKIVLDLNFTKTESERSKKYLFVTKVDIVEAEIWVFFYNNLTVRSK